MDRSKINRALAKAMAYRACGKDALADQWAAHLLYLLEGARLLGDAAGAAQEPER